MRIPPTVPEACTGRDDDVVAHLVAFVWRVAVRDALEDDGATGPL